VPLKPRYATSVQFSSAKLCCWARRHHEVIALHVFGSRAAGTARKSSDLDIALELVDGGPNDANDLSLLMTHDEAWREEIARLTGLKVDKLYLRSDPKVRWRRVVEVYRRARRR